MNKKVILGLALAAIMGSSAVAQTDEVAYVEDPAQGVLLNKFKSNWFISAEGGVNVMFSKYDQHRNFGDRLAPAASIYVGKWFSPIIGVRIGADYMGIKSLSEVEAWTKPGDYRPDGYYKQKYHLVGPTGDVLLNLTNWWCGYKPNRVYNASFYLGGGGYFALGNKYIRQNDGTYKKDGVENLHSFTSSLHAGLLNTFNVSKQVAINLDLRAYTLDAPRDRVQTWEKTAWNGQVLLGVTYFFNKRTWDAPVVPLCPEAEDCSAIEARLQAANARIGDLEAELRDCLNRPLPQCEEAVPALTTIYYPCGVSRLSSREVTVLRSVADVMKNTPDQKYKVTGWADNYTGTDAINERLRHARANGVAKQLKRFGVDESQLEVGINNSDLTTYGKKAVSLDRAVTIELAK